MRLKTCPACKQLISKRAKSCPHCGYQRRRLGCGGLIGLVLLACVGLVLLAAMIVAINPSVGQRNTSSSSTERAKPNPTNPKPVTGDLAELRMGSSKSVLVSPTRAGYERLTRLGHAKDIEGINQMIRSGSAWEVPAGTPCRVLDAGLLTYEVRILKGRYADRSAFVVQEFVVAPRAGVGQDSGEGRPGSRRAEPPTGDIPPAPEPDITSDPTERDRGTTVAEPTPARLQLRALLKELDSFRNTAQFRRFGFATGGPYHDWLKRVEAVKATPGLSFDDKVSAGDLLTLGLAYLPSSTLRRSDREWFRRSVMEGSRAAPGLGDD